MAHKAVKKIRCDHTIKVVSLVTILMKSSDVNADHLEFATIM